MEDQSGRIGLAGKIDPRLLAKAEDLLVSGKPFHTHTGCDLHHRVVAGFHQGLLHRKDAVAVNADALDPVAAHLLGAVADKGLLGADHPLLQGSRHR